MCIIQHNVIHLQKNDRPFVQPDLKNHTDSFYVRSWIMKVSFGSMHTLILLCVSLQISKF
jgi:hypothetical protein